MFENIKNIIVGCIGGAGFLLILGVAGSDCGGSCMEEAMPLDKMMIYGAIGIMMMAYSIYFLNKRS